MSDTITKLIGEAHNSVEMVNRYNRVSEILTALLDSAIAGDSTGWFDFISRVPYKVVPQDRVSIEWSSFCVKFGQNNKDVCFWQGQTNMFMFGASVTEVYEAAREALKYTAKSSLEL